MAYRETGLDFGKFLQQKCLKIDNNNSYIIPRRCETNILFTVVKILNIKESFSFHN